MRDACIGFLFAHLYTISNLNAKKVGNPTFLFTFFCKEDCYIYLFFLDSLLLKKTYVMINI